MLAYGTFGIPLAASPIAFSLLALPLTGSADDGAAIVLAMTLAQVVGAVPMSRLGSRWRTVPYLRTLIAIRAVALCAMAGLAAAGAPMWSLVTAAVVSGGVGGAAYGFLRLLLNDLVSAMRLPRALGIAATLNEVTYATSPVLASALGAISPVLGLAVLACLGATPMLLVPSVPQTRRPRSAGSSLGLLTLPVLAWLACQVACGATVAGVEIGAVSLALGFGLKAEAGFVFALSLCLASISGGVWVSARNREASRGEIVGYLAVTTAGAVLVLGRWTLASTLVGAVLIGFFIAPLGTHFSIVLDRLAPPSKRAEAFALLRTAGLVGIILTSGALAVAGTGSALAMCVALTAGATLVVASMPYWKDAGGR
ncbi:MAG: MFS transporter [Actinomycetaceae bacterium]|nr:MFS transporter [Actinomycetaceae bacterium]